MKKILKLMLILVISFGTMNIFASPVNKKTYDAKVKKYYSNFKKEYQVLPIDNKKRILSSYQKGLKHNLGLTLAGTTFLESRGKTDGVSVNNNGDYISYNCGEYGINTMTYLMDIGKKTKNLKAHKQACQKLIKDKQLNLSMALKVYNYAKDRYNNDTIKVWNYYASGRDKIVGDRIYKMKAITMVLNEELKVNNKTSITSIASNKEGLQFNGTTLASYVIKKNKYG